ncbi:phospholipase B1, membrane-associated [Megalopta genalis]|uniref:phospholipase B1, membrane-associated n=1 Tax=Megalopta genalis TaxID=115081 RepID=UPI003FD5CB24
MRALRLLLVLQLCTLCTLCTLSAAQRTELDNPFYLQLYGQLRNIFFRVFAKNTENRRIHDGPALPNVQDEVPLNVPFPCNVTGSRSSQIPTSVHRLRPGDIDIIGGIGDSMTAGNAVFSKSILEILIESRGVSGSSGGQGTWRTYTTLPNILKEFNPKLNGYAVGDSYITHEASQFNVAEAGAMSRDMPFMAEYLVNRMRKDPRVDMNKHWKLITMMVGSNDFCINMCGSSSPWSILEEHKEDLVKTLRILKANLPRTYVALILSPHLRVLVEAQDNTKDINCYMTTRFECSCLLGLQFRSMRNEYYRIMDRWHDLDRIVAEYPEFHTDDFTVEMQPCLANVKFPRHKDGNIDESYFAADCFHVTQKTNALYGNCLWNNLMESYDEKSDHWLPLFQKFLCPTRERPYLVTRQNSKGSNNL